MKPSYHTKSGLFLLEMIISILFFAVMSAVCVQMFTLSHIKSIKSRDLSIAVNKAESVAAYFKSQKNISENIDDVFVPSDEGSKYVIYFDNKWNITDSQPTYKLSLTVDDSSAITSADILIENISQNNEPIYSLSVSKYEND